VSTRVITANNRRTDNLIVLGAIEHHFSPSYHHVYFAVSHGTAARTRPGASQKPSGGVRMGDKCCPARWTEPRALKRQAIADPAVNVRVARSILCRLGDAIV
jgi:hypothetical protein